MVVGKQKAVYSTRQTTIISAGMSRRKNIQKRYWVAWEDDDGQIVVQPLSRNMIPTGRARNVPALDFHAHFQHEPDFAVDPTSTKVKQIWKGGLKDAAPQSQKIEPDMHLTQPEEVDSGVIIPEPEIISLAGYEITEEPEPAKPQKRLRSFPLVEEEPEPDEPDEVEKDARMDFGMGLTYLKTGQQKKATTLFIDIAERDADYKPRHKHMFNDFGVGLRKSRLPDIAVKHYAKAVQLGPYDENLYMNLARAYLDQGDFGMAERFVRASLRLNPDFAMSKKFLTYLRKQIKKQKRYTFNF